MEKDKVGRKREEGGRRGTMKEAVERRAAS
jgi:hypothetical protein